MKRMLIVLLISAAFTPAVIAAKAKKVWPPATPVEGAELKVNEWVAIEKHGASRRRSGGHNSRIYALRLDPGRAKLLE